ncbi:phytanoyl-CoA dioxygenase family protein [Falsiroseomonas oryzae]|uniref:phytanoyl-CoA dioxygenase family protein n=1 Tax=Falsiroseomonas oryzae TaxID=2766473 RepID=UPI0022EB994D|nr:phytanoyl-CoA dioxygenase family protein [Roseomonas sp. MO-31]
MAEIAPAAIAAFQADGAVLLPGLFAGEVERLRAALDRLRADPGPLAEVYGGDGGFYGDRFVWTRDAAIEDCVRHGPGGPAIAALLGAREVRLYCDHVLVKEPGTGQPTPWHHDLQAWPIEGAQIASLWVALDPVTRENGAVEFVAGSHLWGRRFRSDSFGRSGATFAPAEDDGLEPCPDMDRERDRHRFLCWEMAPGDALAFHALTVHGAPGNRSAARRRAISFRYAGDDVRWVQRPGRTAKLIRDPGLRPGDGLDRSDLFPRVFPLEPAT